MKSDKPVTALCTQAPHAFMQFQSHPVLSSAQLMLQINKYPFSDFRFSSTGVNLTLELSMLT